MDGPTYYNYYKNIILYIAHRGLTATYESPLTEKEFTRVFEGKWFVNIPTEESLIIMTHPLHKYGTFNAETKKLVKTYLGKSVYSECLLICEIVYHRDDKLHMSKQLVHKMQKEINTLFPSVWMQVRPYSVFIANIPIREGASVHSLPDQEKAMQELKIERREVNELSSINIWDPPIVWLGGRRGQIIEVNRITPSVGLIRILHVIVD